MKFAGKSFDVDDDYDDDDQNDYDDYYEPIIFATVILVV